MAKWKLGEQWSTADGSLPPWDGTGVPLPVDENGWPVVPGGGGPVAPVLTNFAVTPVTVVQDSDVQIVFSVTIDDAAAIPNGTFALGGDKTLGGGWVWVGNNGSVTTVVTNWTVQDYTSWLIFTPAGAGAADWLPAVSNEADWTVTAPVVEPPTGDDLAGWTKTELLQFAADHEPPIEVPSGATKPQIIALILAAIEADQTKEN